MPPDPLEQFQVALAQLVADPRLVIELRRDPAGTWATELLEPLNDRDRERLVAMAEDPRIEVLCSLYRSNRLTALVRTVPQLVDSLGSALDATVSRFWREVPRRDLQFLSEGRAFCRFVAATSDERAMVTAAIAAESSLAGHYGV
jgi:hypothetical protein